MISYYAGLRTGDRVKFLDNGHCSHIYSDFSNLINAGAEILSFRESNSIKPTGRERIYAKLILDIDPRNPIEIPTDYLLHE